MAMQSVLIAIKLFSRLLVFYQKYKKVYFIPTLVEQVGSWYGLYKNSATWRVHYLSFKIDKKEKGTTRYTKMKLKN